MIEPTPTLAVYNPALLSKTNLKQQFVARRPLLRRLVDDLRLEGTQQHHVILGGRGMGRTTLLRRLKVALLEDLRLSQKWIPLALPEEHHGVTRLSDLWERGLDALGDALQATGDEAASSELDAIIERLPGEEDARARAALSALLAWAEGKRGVVLLIDNLDLVLEQLGEHHWAIREALSGSERLVLVGSAVDLPEVDDYESAFYGFFRIHELRRLAAAEARAVVERLHGGLRPLLLDEPGQFEAVHRMTAGSPREMALLALVLAQDPLLDAPAAVERLLDLATPVHQARLDALAGQPRQVVAALALGWDPLTAAMIAERTRLEVTTVSSQLNRLLQARIVQKVPLPPGRRAGFQLADRTFNLWFLLRSGPRHRREVAALARFLAAFHAAAERGRALPALVADPDQPGGSPAASPGALAWLRAILANEEEDALLDRWADLEATIAGLVRAGLAAEVAKALDETGWSESWRPLRVALAAVGNPDRLLTVAPEVRAPAQELLARLTAPEPAE